MNKRNGTAKRRRLQSIEALPSAPSPRRTEGAQLGRIVGLKHDAPLVVASCSELESPVAALTCVTIEARDVGREVVLMFEAGEPQRPIVVGFLERGRATYDAQHDVVFDAPSLRLVAKRSITLACGAATITLDRSGKITIRGAQVVSHADGINRIRGGSVQLN
jgi:hypothetical protein